MRIFVSLAILPILAAQTGSPGPTMTSPSLGFVFDERFGAIRGIAGVPGAAAVETAIDPPGAIDIAFVAASSRLALVRWKEGGAAVLRWSGGSVTSASLDTDLNTKSAVEFDRTGDSAVLLNRAGKVELWSGLKSTPELRRDFAVEATSVAISEDGSTAAATLESGGIAILGSEIRILLTESRFSAIGFVSSTDFVASAEARLVLVRGDSISEIPLEGASKLGPLGVSRDGRSVVVADWANRNLLRVDLTTSEVSTVACDCSPKRLERLDGNSLFRMVDPAKGAMALFDGDSAPPRIMELPENAGGAQ